MTDDRIAELEARNQALERLLEAATAPPEGVWIDGVPYTDEDLEYGEQRELREKVRELAPNGSDVGDPDDMDFVPGVVWIIRRRTNPEYTIDEALKVKPRDVKKPDDDGPPSTGSETPGESGSPTT